MENIYVMLLCELISILWNFSFFIFASATKITAVQVKLRSEYCDKSGEHFLYLLSLFANNDSYIPGQL